jgi:hypothetical protein
METPTKVYSDRKMWFSMWFLGAIVTFGAAFFPMYYRLVQGRNKHFQHDREWQEQISSYLKKHDKEMPAVSKEAMGRNAKVWTASIILIIPNFVILYLLSKDLATHELEQDTFLAVAFPERMFMPQTIPIKTYVLITIVTLGVGGIYWLYKVVNLYNAHFKAQSLVEKEIGRLMEEQEVVEQL